MTSRTYALNLKLDGSIKFELGKEKNNCWDNFFFYLSEIQVVPFFQAALTEIHAYWKHAK